MDNRIEFMPGVKMYADHAECLTQLNKVFKTVAFVVQGRISMYYTNQFILLYDRTHALMVDTYVILPDESDLSESIFDTIVNILHVAINNIDGSTLMITTCKVTSEHDILPLSAILKVHTHQYKLKEMISDITITPYEDEEDEFDE